ncbi:regulatory subunit of type II PKA R-subunit [Trichuris suis]|nr:regulatory subunit of type II PKA R-subunit [Trichuris suis]
MDSDACQGMDADDIPSEYQFSTDSDDEDDPQKPVSNIVASYLRDHNIAGLMKKALIKLCLEMPDDPVRFLHLHFARLYAKNTKEEDLYGYLERRSVIDCLLYTVSNMIVRDALLRFDLIHQSLAVTARSRRTFVLKLEAASAINSIFGDRIKEKFAPLLSDQFARWEMYFFIIILTRHPHSADAKKPLPDEECTSDAVNKPSAYVSFHSRAYP